MAEQLILLSLVAAVATGLIAVTVSALRFPPGMPALARVFLGNLLLFNLLILGGLVLRYAMLSEARESLGGGVVLSILVLLNTFKLAWLVAFVTLTRALPGKPSDTRAGDARVSPRLAVAAVAVAALWLLLQLSGGAAERVGGIGLEVLVVVVALAACIALALRARGIGRSPRRSSLTAFAGFHGAFFAVLAASLLYGWSSSAGQTDGAILFNSVLLIAFNCFPLVWLRWFPLKDGATVGADGDRFGLTPREREIVELICTGRTNREIAEQLFISLATVKDHNHHIFRKTDVRNRVELVNLFREPASGGTDGG